MVERAVTAMELVLARYVVEHGHCECPRPYTLTIGGDQVGEPSRPLDPCVYCKAKAWHDYTQTERRRR